MVSRNQIPSQHGLRQLHLLTTLIFYGQQKPHSITAKIKTSFFSCYFYFCSGSRNQIPSEQGLRPISDGSYHRSFHQQKPNLIRTWIKTQLLLFIRPPSEKQKPNIIRTKIKTQLLLFIKPPTEKQKPNSIRTKIKTNQLITSIIFNYYNLTMKSIKHSVELKNISYGRNKFKFQKKVKSFTFLTATLMLMFFSSTASSFNSNSSNLSNDEPIDVIVGNAAPHIPVMIKSEKTSNINAINQWIASYPEEVIQYKKVIVPALKNVKVKTLSPTFSAVYNETKAQYKLIAKILNW